MQVQTIDSSTRERLRAIEKERARLFAMRAQTRQHLSRIRRKARRQAREAFACQPEEDVTWLVQWITLGLPNEAESVRLYGKRWEAPRLAGQLAPPGEADTIWRQWNREIRSGHREIHRIEKRIAALDDERRALLEKSGEAP